METSLDSASGVRVSERPHGADRCHTAQCREGGGTRDGLRPTGTDDGQRRVAPGCLEGAQVAGWGGWGRRDAVLGGGGDGVDASCVAFLVRRAVRHPCHNAEADPRGPCDQEISLFLDKVIDVPVVQVVQLPEWWSRRAENCGCPQLQFLSRRSHARCCARQVFGGVAGAVLIEGRRHPCLYAEADPHCPVLFR